MFVCGWFDTNFFVEEFALYLAKILIVRFKKIILIKILNQNLLL